MFNGFTQKYMYLKKIKTFVETLGQFKKIDTFMHMLKSNNLYSKINFSSNEERYRILIRALSQHLSFQQILIKCTSSTENYP